MEVGNCEPFTQLVPLKEAAFKKAKDPSLVAMSPKKDTYILLSPNHNSSIPDIIQILILVQPKFDF